ncbi:MAG: hypothetical protein KGJ02_07675, partial [Verrucomicrobiota bacterium]|nr:hypothetical protein [Verrucomicrobiota bacterium]
PFGPARFAHLLREKTVPRTVFSIPQPYRSSIVDHSIHYGLLLRNALLRSDFASLAPFVSLLPSGLIGLRKWSFYSKVKAGKQESRILLTLAQHTKIERHVKVRTEASPYDPDFNGA